MSEQSRMAELEAEVLQLRTQLALLQSQAHTGILRLGDTAPNFNAITQYGDFNLYDYMGDEWIVLFSHPADFTPVCTTELARAAELEHELANRHVKICALSVDSVEHHLEWIADIEAINGIKIKYPIIADTDRRIAILYNMLSKVQPTPDISPPQNKQEQRQHHHTNAALITISPTSDAHNQQSLPLTVRSVHIIGNDHKIKTMILYPATTGRSFDEILRVIDSLQLSEKYKVATPCEWRYGDTCMVLPTVDDNELPSLFPKGVKIVRPWLRTTPFPE